MKVLITGVAGYIGSHTAFQALKLGHDVIGVDNLTRGSKSNLDVLRSAGGNRFDFLEQNFSDITQNDLKGIDAVIHFAGYKSVAESIENPTDYINNNYLNTRRLLLAVRDSEVKTFVFSSTSAVYASASSEILETSSLGPISPYGSSKLAAEDAIRSILVGKNVEIFRYFNVAGMNTEAEFIFPGKPEALIPQIVSRYLKGESAKVFGTDYPTRDGSCIRDFIHVDDLALAHLLVLDKLVLEADTLNLGSGKGYSILEVMSVMKSIAPDFKYEIGPRREGDIVASYCSPQKAKEILSWETKLSLAEMILSELAYQRKNL